MSEGIAELTEEEKKVYRVQGFSCANCAGKFERNVKKLPEVQDAKVNFGASKISVYGSATVKEDELSLGSSQINKSTDAEKLELEL